MKVEGQITGESVNFKAPSRFSNTRTEIDRVSQPFGTLSYLNENPGAPKDKPSYYRRTYGNYYGVQVRGVARNDQGYRTFEEVQK